MRRLRKDEKAVSPVIATILMVAITIILAAVIASFVYGYTSSLERTKQISATANLVGKGGTSQIVVTYQGGPDQDQVNTLKVYAYKKDGTAIGNATLSTTVGSTVSITTTESKGKNHVIVIATFDDGSSQTVLDTWV